MAAESVDEWEPENIPSDHRLFMRVHRDMVVSASEVKIGAFRVPDMSTNWERYATAEQTRREARQPPEHYTVLAMVVGDVEQIDGQTVVHDPIDQRRLTDNPAHRILNRAHTLVKGEKSVERTRVLFRRISTIVIPIETS